ncbi:MAG: OprO/OprP family phosphate-selective porin [Muribaculaceae bacterium]|nr:OprO/OprP family phosphate-selective porin [Muribaculaceae bacterium]
MKKIVLILTLILLPPLQTFAQEEINLTFDNDFKKLAINDSRQNTFQQKENEPIKINPSEVFETSNQTREQAKLFSGISQGVKNLYNLQIDNTNVPSSLFSDQLTKKFENGPLESLHTWGVVQGNFDTMMEESENGYTKYNPALVNVLFDGKFHGGNENFRLMLDPSHQHNHSFMKQFVQDAYFESHRIPHHTILFGNSRTGTGYEGAQSPYTLPFINRSQISRNFANIRKVGLRVKGDYSFADYDIGAYSSDTFFTEFMPGAEFDAWVNLKPLAKTNGKYGKLTTGGGIVTGERNSTDYFTGGAYLGYEYKKFWTRMEYAISNGSNGATGLSNKHHQGWYVTLGYHITKKLELLARYDEFDPDKEISNNNTREYTAGINYYIKGQALKLILNYIFCQNDAKPNSHRILTGFQIAI